MFLNEIDDYNENDSDVSDIDYVLESEHDTDTTQSNDSADEAITNVSRHEITVENIDLPTYVGKDKSIWYMYPPPRNVRTRAHNTLNIRPGPIGYAKQVKTPYESWSLFFPDTVIMEIVKCTNINISRIRPNYNRPRAALDTNIEEMKAVFGLLYMAGVMKSSHQNLSDLWARDGTGVDFFRSTMCLTRFQFILRALRFDDITTRNERRSVDKLAPIRNIFNGFVQKCQENYVVGEYTTIDEILESFRGRCNFRQYIRNKPAKYGIKIFALCDARKFYTLNMEVYAGKQPDGPYQIDNNPHKVVERLVIPITKSGRNVTMDNWFISIPLVQTLLQNHRLTVVGTIRKNKREIPPIFVQTKIRPVNSSLFGYGKTFIDTTLLSYVPKKNKVVTLVSTMHHSDDIDDSSGEAMKPEILTFYNHTKGGVDTVDELKGSYSVSRTSCRWPLTIFYSLLNIAGINSFIIIKDNDSEKHKKLTRRYFLKELSKELCMSYWKHRLTIKTLPKHLKISLKNLTGQQQEQSERQDCPGRCVYCSTKKNRKTNTRCIHCNSPICREHTVPACPECSRSMAVDETENSDEYV